MLKLAKPGFIKVFWAYNYTLTVTILYSVVSRD